MWLELFGIDMQVLPTTATSRHFVHANKQPADHCLLEFLVHSNIL
jgi:hypothetical protein